MSEKRRFWNDTRAHTLSCLAHLPQLILNATAVWPNFDGWGPISVGKIAPLISLTLQHDGKGQGLCTCDSGCQWERSRIRISLTGALFRRSSFNCASPLPIACGSVLLGMAQRAQFHDWQLGPHKKSLLAHHLPDNPNAAAMHQHPSIRGIHQRCCQLWESSASIGQKRGSVHTKSLCFWKGKSYTPAISRVKLAKFSAKLVANFRRSLEGDFRASFAGENRQKHFPPKLHRKFHHQTSLRGSGLWRALEIIYTKGKGPSRYLQGTSSHNIGA